MTRVRDLTLEIGMFNTACGYMDRKQCDDPGATRSSPGVACKIVSWSTNTIDDAFTITQPVEA